MNRHRTYCPQAPPLPADPLCGNPCDSRDPRSHVPPLKGLRETLTASVSYRASVPAGLGGHGMLTSYRALSPAADRQNRSFKALSGKGSVPAPPPPFRHTPRHSRPRHTATVWRNLGQHPHRDGTYTFSAKEKDVETGLSYFGSRYYSSDLSIWLSVDPQSDKYASLSPYVYCADNPVKLVDPDGEEIYVGEDYYYRNGHLYYKGTTDVYVPKQGSFEEKALNSLNELQSTKQGGDLMTPFEGNTGKDVVINNACNNPHTPGKVEVNDESYSEGVYMSAAIYWNPDGEQLLKTLEPNATTDLGHEFSHVYDKATGAKYPTDYYDYCPRNEWQAVYRENIIRGELGEPYRKGYKVLRYNRMDGTTTPYLTKMLTSGGLPFLP